MQLQLKNVHPLHKFIVIRRPMLGLRFPWFRWPWIQRMLLMKMYSTPSPCTSNNHGHCCLPSSRASSKKYSVWGGPLRYYHGCPLGSARASFACQPVHVCEDAGCKKSVRGESYWRCRHLADWRINASFICCRDEATISVMWHANVRSAGK